MLILKKKEKKKQNLTDMVSRDEGEEEVVL